MSGRSITRKEKVGVYLFKNTYDWIKQTTELLCQRYKKVSVSWVINFFLSQVRRRNSAEKLSNVIIDTLKINTENIKTNDNNFIYEYIRRISEHPKARAKYGCMYKGIKVGVSLDKDLVNWLEKVQELVSNKLNINVSRSVVVNYILDAFGNKMNYDPNKLVDMILRTIKKIEEERKKKEEEIMRKYFPMYPHVPVFPFGRKKRRIF